MRLVPPTRAKSPEANLAPQLICWASSAAGDKLAVRPSMRGRAEGGPGLGIEVTLPQKSAIVKPDWADPTSVVVNSRTPVAASMSHQGHFGRLSTNWCAGL